jgi:hypothetical protein
MMNAEVDLDLIRRVLPAPAGPSDQARFDGRAALLEAIAAEGGGGRGWRPGLRAPRRAGRLMLVWGALLLGATGATAATIVAIDGFSHDTPTQLFSVNPDRIGNPWMNQALVPGTVRLVESFRVPSVGEAQYWTARATHHGICVGLRLPGGVWAGSENRFELSGPVPGCVYKFSPNPKAGWSPKRGFFWVEYQVGGSWQGRIVIGTVASVGRPVAVRDALTGTRAPVVDGRYFAILIPPSHRWQLRYRLETLDRSGSVLARSTETIEP